MLVLVPVFQVRDPSPARDYFVSSSADFRGPDGVWTLRAAGKEREKPTVSTLKAMPTATHMSLVALERANVLKYLISQNCDGLHRRSGFSPAKVRTHSLLSLFVCMLVPHCARFS